MPPWETIGIYLFVLEAHPDGPQGRADKRASSRLIRSVARSLRETGPTYAASTESRCPRSRQRSALHHIMSDKHSGYRITSAEIMAVNDKGSRQVKGGRARFDESAANDDQGGN